MGLYTNPLKHIYVCQHKKICYFYCSLNYHNNQYIPAQKNEHWAHSSAACSFIVPTRTNKNIVEQYETQFSTFFLHLQLHELVHSAITQCFWYSFSIIQSLLPETFKGIQNRGRMLSSLRANPKDPNVSTLKFKQFQREVQSLNHKATTSTFNSKNT